MNPFRQQPIVDPDVVAEALVDAITKALYTTGGYRTHNDARIAACACVKAIVPVMRKYNLTPFK